MIPKRIVIDTNVCLDLFVFHDRRWQALLIALNEGRFEAVTRADCRQEWLCVLEYTHLPLDAVSRPTAAAAFDGLIHCLEPQVLVPRSTIRLPVCSDPDDQKFLELARDAEAQTLITKDKALLKLAKRTARVGLFSIVSPDRWTPDA